MNTQIEQNAPEITVGMSVVYTARNGSPEERYNIAKSEGVSYGDILTVRSISLNEKQQTVLEFYETNGKYSVAMFVQSEFWFRHCFEVGQTVVFTGRGNPSQVEYMPAQGINRGDKLTVDLIRSTERSVSLKFKEIHGFHNGLMFVDTALWFHPV